MKSTIPLLLVVLASAPAFGQEMQMMRSMSVLKYDPPPPAEMKTATVKLRKIYMGECGNDNNCHHEPVAGRVVCQFFHRQTGQVSSLSGRAQIWQSNGHSQVCDNYYAPGGNGEDLSYPLGQNQYQFDYQSLVNNHYYLRVLFNLGVEHQDNPFAGRGGHWLTQGDDLLEADIALDLTTINRRATVIGPFQTQSDRCHQFWLEFSFSFEE